MGSQPQPILPERNDPKYIDLINKITEKTRANKIRWQMTQTGVSATAPGKIQLGFVRSRGLLGDSWSLFTVRDESGTEILRVDNIVALARVFGVNDIPPLPKAADALYAAIEQSGRAELEKVIELIDRI